MTRGDGYDVDGEGTMGAADIDGGEAPIDAIRLDEATSLLEQHIEQSGNDDVRVSLRVAVSHIRRASVFERAETDTVVEVGPYTPTTTILGPDPATIRTRGDER